jgi:hypothetical protein
MRYILTFFIFSNSLILFGQNESFLVHFNNADDRELKKAVIEKSIKIDDFVKIASQTNNGDIKIQIIFYDQKAQGVLDVNAPVTPEDFAKKWMEKYDPADKRILFLFSKSADYSFHSIYVTSNLIEKQLPQLVVNFINEQIIKKETSIERAISEGINAFKNAFDQRFKERLIENAPILTEDNKYYKGYSCIDFNYFYFKKVENPKQQNNGCSNLFFQDFPNFNVVVPNKPPSINIDPDRQSVLMDYFAGKPLAYKPNAMSGQKIDILVTDQNNNNLVYFDNVKGYQNAKLSNYTYDYFDFSKPETTYTDLNDNKIPASMRTYLNKIYWNNYQFKEWKKEGTKPSVFLFEESQKACEGTHQVRVFNGQVKAKIDQADEWQCLSMYGDREFRLAQPTWCNVFARELSNKVFGHGAFSAGLCGDILRNDFQAKKDLYVAIPEIAGEADNLAMPKAIWNLVNKGYPVYFIDDGHIETGFPDKYASTSYRYRYESDNRYDPGKNQSEFDQNELIERDYQDEFIVVGSGKSVGFKDDWENYKWLKKASKYVYLGYLKERF